MKIFPGDKISIKNKGFTLIEVAVALAILAWVLSSSVYAVKQYSDERLGMRERFYSSQVAWNQLMEEYRIESGMVPINESPVRPNSGEELQNNQYWMWQSDVTPAMGQNLYQYRIDVGHANSERPTLSRSMFLVVNESGVSP